MKEIYVLNENGQPELISAGVERYEELQNVLRNRVEANEMAFLDNNMQLQSLQYNQHSKHVC